MLLASSRREEVPQIAKNLGCGQQTVRDAIHDFNAEVNMVPALGFRRGAPAFSVGAPGGRAIISAIPQVISNLVDGRATAPAAVEAPRLHTEGGEVLVSTRVGDKALAGLAGRGHEVVPKEESYSTLNFARPVAIRVTAKGLEAGCEQYSAAAAAGH